MPYAFAGLYADALTDRFGNGQADIAVLVRVPGTLAEATLYTDRTKATPASNPTTTDELGNLTFYADPGEYDLVANGTTVRVQVPIDPFEGDLGPRTVTVGEGGDFATLTAAYAAIVDAAADRRYLVVVRGEVTEPALVEPKSYIDLRGEYGATITAPREYISDGWGPLGSRAAFLFRGVEAEWENLTLLATGDVEPAEDGYMVLVSAVMVDRATVGPPEWGDDPAAPEFASRLQLRDITIRTAFDNAQPNGISGAAFAVAGGADVEMDRCAVESETLFLGGAAVGGGATIRAHRCRFVGGQGADGFFLGYYDAPIRGEFDECEFVGGDFYGPGWFYAAWQGRSWTG